MLPALKNSQWVDTTVPFTKFGASELFGVVPPTSTIYGHSYVDVQLSYVCI